MTSRSAATAAQVGFIVGAVTFTVYHFSTRGPSPRFSYIIDIHQITDIDERRHTTGVWLKRGALLGAAVGLGLVAAAVAEHDECDHCVHPAAFAVPFTVGGSLIGATLGAVAGSRLTAWRPQRW